MQPVGDAGLFVRELPNHWAEQLRTVALSVGTYCIPTDGADDQTAHGEDEVYLVRSGRARLVAGASETSVGPGSVVFVPAGEEHRFVDVTEDLCLLAVFAPPYGTVG